MKDKGGLTIVQSAESATHDSMLTSAIRTGAVDLELPVENMPGKLVEYFDHLKKSGLPKSPTGSSRAGAAEEDLRAAAAQTGHDFSRYKTTTLVRRIQRRMQVHQLASVPAYVERLRQDPRRRRSSSSATC